MRTSVQHIYVSVKDVVIALDMHAEMGEYGPHVRGRGHERRVFFEGVVRGPTELAGLETRVTYYPAAQREGLERHYADHPESLAAVSHFALDGHPYLYVDVPAEEGVYAQVVETARLALLARDQPTLEVGLACRRRSI
jgi:hypothetical protein